MRLTSTLTTLAAAFALMTSAAVAGTVAPGDVKFEEGAIAKSLTGVKGDPKKGAEWFKNRKLGNCLACHVNSAMKTEQFHGEIGPAVDGAGSRYTEAQLRGIIVNSKKVFGDQTAMPGFYRLAGFNRVAPKFEAKTILTAQQVEDVVAYLMTLKDK